MGEDIVIGLPNRYDLIGNVDIVKGKTQNLTNPHTGRIGQYQDVVDRIIDRGSLQYLVHQLNHISLRQVFNLLLRLFANYFSRIGRVFLNDPISKGIVKASLKVMVKLTNRLFKVFRLLTRMRKSKPC
jgi:hypothetical protein